MVSAMVSVLVEPVQVVILERVIMTDIVNHSSFSTQVSARRKERDKGLIENVTYRACLSDVTIPANQSRDIRLKSESFRADVRLVMDYLGIENNGENFKIWDKMLEWTTFANNIRNPSQTARVEPLWAGHPIGHIITVELPGRSQAQALKNLDKSKYLFREWSW